VTSQCFNIVDKKPAVMEDLVGDLVNFSYHPNFPSASTCQVR
jgi:hypothetical protein